MSDGEGVGGHPLDVTADDLERIVGQYDRDGVWLEVVEATPLPGGGGRFVAKAVGADGREVPTARGDAARHELTYPPRLARVVPGDRFPLAKRYRAPRAEEVGDGGGS